MSTTKPAKPTMRDKMPLTAGWIDECREKHGKLHVDTCLREAVAGKRNRFFAVEAGHVLGTPFDWTERAMFIVSMSVLTGGKFVAAIADPKAGFELTAEQAGQEGAHAD